MNSLNLPVLGFIIVLGMVIVHSQVPSPNLLKNPGFELGKQSWGFQIIPGESDTGKAEFSLDDPAAVHSGTKGAKVTVTKAAMENWHIQLNAPWNWVAIENQSYRLTGWGKCQGMYKYFHLAVQDGAPSYTYRYGEDFPLDTVWQQFKIEWVSDVTGNAGIRFNLFLGLDTGVYYFDDFVLDTVSALGISFLPITSDINKLETGQTHGIRDILGRTMNLPILPKRQRRFPVVITKP